MVIQEVLGIFGSANRMEHARSSFQAEKVSEVVSWHVHPSYARTIGVTGEPLRYPFHDAGEGDCDPETLRREMRSVCEAVGKRWNT